MWKDLSDRYFKLNRMRSRFDDRISDGALEEETRRIHFKRILSNKKQTSMIRLIILLAASIWAYYYFTNVN